MQEFMLKEGYKQIFHLDSDNVLLKNINDFRYNNATATVFHQFKIIIVWIAQFIVDLDTKFF